MNDEELAGEIRRRALALGYAKCGIVSVDEMSGYADALADRAKEYPEDRPFLGRLSGFADPRKAVPWARSVVVLVRPYGQYTVPGHLRGHIASAYLNGGIHVEGSRNNADSKAFGDCLETLGVKAVTNRKHGLTAMRWAAQKAGIGIVRKNNFFYTESGSWVLLEAWLIDRALELKEECSLRPCAENCRRCMDACPTSALRRPYSTRPTTCVSFLTGYGGEDLTSHPASEAMGEWIFGCDACQTACPHNQTHDGEKEDFPGLRELAGRISLTQILEMDTGTLNELLGENFYYITEERIWKWKVNVLNAMKNTYRDEYLPWIRKAARDPVEQVRAMASWVLQSLGG